MKTQNLFKLLAQKGEKLRFSIGVYENATDKQGTYIAKKAAREFLKFAKFCEDNNLVMSAGVSDFQSVGTASYLSVQEDGKDLLVLLTPHDVVDITPEEGEDDGSSARND